MSLNCLQLKLSLKTSEEVTEKTKNVVKGVLVIIEIEIKS